MLNLIRKWFGNDRAEPIGPPSGKTGNQLTEQDFEGSTSPLATEGGSEFVEFCVSNGSCELEGDVIEQFKAVLAKYPVTDQEEYEHFAVVVRERLISQGLLPQGDPERYQYKVAQWAPLMAEQS